MSLLESVKEAAAKPLTNQDGEPEPLRLEPALSSARIDELERRLPCAIPADVRELLGLCSGFTGPGVDFVDFTGEMCAFEHLEVFPRGHPIAADGYGNFWVVDLWPQSRHWGPIYFACHDAPVILYQSTGLDEFLSELFKCGSAPHKSKIDDVHEDRLFQVWRKNPGVKEHAECLASPDPELCAFAAQLGPRFQFVDMRAAPVGYGFSWGRYGPRTVVKRHGALPIFAYERR
ncbi:MAG TPA: SMI1/KNR4 family protein [Burkholderiales bacterium]|nr:SMI1/KNR4 family protein [Burkholderiales bacterium]